MFTNLRISLFSVHSDRCVACQCLCGGSPGSPGPLLHPGSPGPLLRPGGAVPRPDARLPVPATAYGLLQQPLRPVPRGHPQIPPASTRTWREQNLPEQKGWATATTSVSTFNWHNELMNRSELDFVHAILQFSSGFLFSLRLKNSRPKNSNSSQ